MGTSYNQLNMCERSVIDRLLGEGPAHIWLDGLPLPLTGRG